MTGSLGGAAEQAAARAGGGGQVSRRRAMLGAALGELSPAARRLWRHQQRQRELSRNSRRSACRRLRAWPAGLYPVAAYRRRYYAQRRRLRIVPIRPAISGAQGLGYAWPSLGRLTCLLRACHQRSAWSLLVENRSDAYGLSFARWSRRSRRSTPMSAGCTSPAPQRRWAAMTGRAAERAHRDHGDSRG